MDTFGLLRVSRFLVLILLHCGCFELEIFCLHRVCDLVHDIGGMLEVGLEGC